MFDHLAGSSERLLGPNSGRLSRSGPQCGMMDVQDVFFIFTWKEMYQYNNVSTLSLQAGSNMISGLSSVGARCSERQSFDFFFFFFEGPQTYTVTL